MKKKMLWLLVCLLVCFGSTACQSNPAKKSETSETVERPETADAGEMSTEMSDTEKTSIGVPDTEKTSAGMSDTEKTPTEVPSTENMSAAGSETEEPAESRQSADETETAESEPAENEPAENEPAETGERVSLHRNDPVAANSDVVQRFEYGTTVTVDLDGDGIDERVTVIIEDDPYYHWNTLTLQIDEFFFNKETMKEMIMENPDMYYFYLVDLDVSDTWHEIALYDGGPSGDPNTIFLRYSDGEPVCLGNVCDGPPIKEKGRSTLTITGNGEIVSRCRMSIIETASVGMTQKLSGGSGLDASIEEVVPEFYEFYRYRSQEDWCSVIQELPVYREMTEAEEAVLLLPIGTKLEFTRFYPEEQWLECIYDGGEKTAWLKLEKGKFMPGGIKQWDMWEYISHLNKAG